MTTPYDTQASSRGRRQFLTRLAALGAGVGFLSPARASDALTAQTEADKLPLLADDPWMARLSGNHRVVFHSHMPTDALAIRWAEIFLDTQKRTYGIPESDCGVVVGLNGPSIAWLFNDAMWAKYPTIGGVMGAPGDRNPYSQLVASLVPRGVIVLLCHNSLQRAGSRYLASPDRENDAAGLAFAEEARAKLLPGVEVVQAMIVTIQQAQDRGCRYVYAGG